MKTRRWTIVVTVLSISFSSLIVQSSGDPHVTKKEREEAVSTLDELYAKFLAGTLNEARTNLQKAVSFVHENCTRIPELQSILPICYARLSLLERRAGNEAQSRIYFEKSRYWRIVEREKMRLTADEIIADHDKFTRDDSDKYALEWDEKRTQGQGPAYLKKERGNQ